MAGKYYQPKLVLFVLIIQINITGGLLIIRAFLVTYMIVALQLCLWGLWR